MCADVPTANPDQLDGWNGEEGGHWVAYADAYDRMSEPFNRHLLDAAALSANEEVLDAGDPAKWYGGPPKTCHTVIVAALLRAALDGLGSAADQIDLLSEAQRFARGGVPGLQLAVEFLRRPDALEALPDEVLFAAVCGIGNVNSLGSAESTEEFMLKEISRKADEELESTEWAPVVRDLKAAGASADVSPRPSLAASK